MKLKVRQPDLNPTTARIWLDDHEITSGLMGITICFEPNDITKAELRIMVDDLNLDAETLAVLQAHVQDRDAATVAS